MFIKAIMVPFNQLHCLSVEDTLEHALHVIDSNRLLSLPVVDGKKFIGVLSKQFVYEVYFREYSGSKEEFLQKKVKDMIRTEIMTIRPDTPVEEAASIFITSKIRFIPVTEKKQELVGIVTQQAVFKEYQKLFGNMGKELTIYTYNFKGTLAKITEVIAKNGGDIRNIIQRDTDVMGLQEVYLRVVCKDFDKLVKALKKKGFDARLPQK